MYPPRVSLALVWVHLLIIDPERRERSCVAGCGCRLPAARLLTPALSFLAPLLSCVNSEPPIKPDADAVHLAQAQEHMEERLLVQTIDFGHNSGRPYIHRMPDNDAKEWLALINTQMRFAKRTHHQKVLLPKAVMGYVRMQLRGGGDGLHDGWQGKAGGQARVHRRTGLACCAPQSCTGCLQTAAARIMLQTATDDVLEGASRCLSASTIV